MVVGSIPARSFYAANVDSDCGGEKMTPAGLEPAIPGSVGRCLIHWATGPSVSWATSQMYNKRKKWSESYSSIDAALLLDAIPILDISSGLMHWPQILGTAAIAQLRNRQTQALKVPGSSPGLSILYFCRAETPPLKDMQECILHPCFSRSYNVVVSHPLRM